MHLSRENLSQVALLIDWFSWFVI